MIVPVRLSPIGHQYFHRYCLRALEPRFSRFTVPPCCIWLLLFFGAIFAGHADDDGARAPRAEANLVSQKINRGEEFLKGLFDPSVELLPEYRGSKVYWLYHDNYLAAKLLERNHPDLARRIVAAIHKRGVNHSGKIEILFNEAADPLPFRNYQLTTVTEMDGKTIKTEVVTETPLKGWEAYTDLLLMAAIAEAKSNPEMGKKHFASALEMWDKIGFKDPATRVSGLYATYKIALALIAANRLGIRCAIEEDLLKRLISLQSDSGGWITDYDKSGKPIGMANVETSCMALLALRSSEHHRGQAP